MIINFPVYGEPVAKGRPRFTRKGFAYTPAKTRAAELDFKTQALEYRPPKPLEGALKVTIEIIKMKPKSKPKKITQWTTKPDLDNFIKTLDALNGIFWKDDSQIVEIHASKKYGDSAKIDVTIEEV